MGYRGRQGVHRDEQEVSPDDNFVQCSFLPTFKLAFYRDKIMGGDVLKLISVVLGRWHKRMSWNTRELVLGKKLSVRFKQGLVAAGL